MYQGIRMQSPNFSIEEIEEFKAILALKSDMDEAGRVSKHNCAVVLSINGSTFRDKELLYQDILRSFEKHYMRHEKRIR